MNISDDPSPAAFSILFALIFAVFSLTSLRSVKMVADAVIYHPTVAHYLKYVATTGTYIKRIPGRRSNSLWVLDEGWIVDLKSSESSPSIDCTQWSHC